MSSGDMMGSSGELSAGLSFCREDTEGSLLVLFGNGELVDDEALARR
jgi:hypothetical protein